ncbi:MAG: VWA domain-containing protein [Myxococcales bacterium]|nr:VWA domain-containing protein [Myxococcales bacterium]
MGYGSYSLDAHRAIVEGRAGRTAVFESHVVHPSMDPKGKTRESRDSEAHPESVSIVFALDVSTSMGSVPHLLATKTLPTFMQATLEVIPDPQILFMAFLDARYSRAPYHPLQVGQFESDAALIDHWLKTSYIPAEDPRAPRNIPPQYIGESYDLAMYFAARHTSIDCFEKRGKRGYFFLTGDEAPFPRLDREHVRAAIDERAQDELALHELVAELETRYEPFFLIPEPWRAERDDCAALWSKLLHERCIVLETAEDTAVACAVLVGIGEGVLEGQAAIEAKLEALGRSGEARDRVVRAVLPYANARGNIAPPEPLAKRADCDAAGL